MLAVTVDGAAQNNKVFHHNGTTLIDPSLLKAVRVDAGVAPADAGFAALTGSIVYEIPIQGGDFVFESPGRGQVRWPVKSPTYLGFSVWQRLIDDGAFDVAFSDDNGRVLYRSDVFKEGSVAEADPHAEESERTIGGVRQWIVDFTAELI